MFDIGQKVWFYKCPNHPKTATIVSKIFESYGIEIEGEKEVKVVSWAHLFATSKALKESIEIDITYLQRYIDNLA